MTREGSELLPRGLSDTATAPPPPNPQIFSSQAVGRTPLRLAQLVVQALPGPLGGTRAEMPVAKELDEALAGGPWCSLARTAAGPRHTLLLLKYQRGCPSS